MGDRDPQDSKGCLAVVYGIFGGAILGGIGYRFGGNIGGLIGWALAIWLAWSTYRSDKQFP